MSDEETIALEAHHDPSEFECDEEQDEENVENNLQRLIENRKFHAHMEGHEENFEEDCGDHDESAESEPMEEEFCSNFDSMWEQVQKISEDLHSKRVVFQELLARLNDHSQFFKIDILVNHFQYPFAISNDFTRIGKFQIAQVDRRMSTLLAEGFNKVLCFRKLLFAVLLFNLLLKVQAASNSIQAAIQLGQKHQADREAMQQEFERLQHRLESVREQLFR